MAEITLRPGSQFPAGTSVSVFPLAARVNGQSPSGPSVATATVSSTSTLTFTGLTVDTDYTAYAVVGGQARYLNFAVKDARLGREPDFATFTHGQVATWDADSEEFDGTEITVVAEGPFDGASALAALAGSPIGATLIETDADGDIVDEWVKVDA